MRQLTPTVFTRQAELWHTNTGIIRRGDSAVVIDPGIFAADFEAIAAELQGVEIVAGFASHAHWDHVLWSATLGADVPRFASDATVRAIQSGEADLNARIDEIEAHPEVGAGHWDRALLVGQQPLPFGGTEIGGIRCELVDVSGHCDGQTAIVFPDDGVAFVADTLSDEEVPSLSDRADALEVYLTALGRLQAVIDRVEWIVPGHGEPAQRAEAQRRLDADRRYLESMPGLVAAADPALSDEALGRQVLAQLNEHRADDGFAWDLHMDVVRRLRGAR